MGSFGLDSPMDADADGRSDEPIQRSPRLVDHVVTLK